MALSQTVLNTYKAHNVPMIDLEEPKAHLLGDRGRIFSSSLRVTT